MDAEIITYLKVIFALAFVLGLIVLSGVFLKKTGLDKKLIGNKINNNRLAVVESLYLDPKNRLVIVKCDEKEMVLLIATNGCLVVSV